MEYTPILEGYSFSSWYLNSQLSLRQTVITVPENDIELFGKWNLILEIDENAVNE